MTKGKDTLERLLHVGQLLSNLAYNMAQRSDLDPRDKKLLNVKVTEWDRAMRDYREPRPRKRTTKVVR